MKLFYSLLFPAFVSMFSGCTEKATEPVPAKLDVDIKIQKVQAQIPEATQNPYVFALNKPWREERSGDFTYGTQVTNGAYIPFQQTVKRSLFPAGHINFVITYTYVIDADFVGPRLSSVAKYELLLDGVSRAIIKMDYAAYSDPRNRWI